MTKLDGKTALVTGASRGIGQYTAKRLAAGRTYYRVSVDQTILEDS